MNLDLDASQKELHAGIQAFMAARVSASDVRGNAAQTGYDPSLLNDLREQGFLDVATRKPHGLLEAVLVTEEVSRVNGLAPVGLHSLAVPFLEGLPNSEPVAICVNGSRGPIRYSAQASILLVLDKLNATAFRYAPEDVEPAPSNYVYAVAYPAAKRQEVLGKWPAELVRRRWQLAIGAEIVGGIDGGLNYLTRYLAGREQFRRKLGSLQALQHRLAEIAVSLELARYLVRDAAWRDDTQAAATAACYAAKAAHTFCTEAHQLAGARGFTQEFGLYRWTLRLELLSREAGGAREHAAIASNSLWGESGSPLDRHTSVDHTTHVTA